jgi:ferritin
MSISDRLRDAINAEIGLEFYAHSQYVAMAAYFEARSLDRLADFFYAQAEEEREHGLKLVRFLTEVGAQPQIPAIDAPVQEFDSPLAIAELFLEQETHVTQKFYEMVNIAREDGDYIAVEFLQWFIAEQREEQAIAGKLCDLINMAGENNMLTVELLVADLEPEPPAG